MTKPELVVYKGAQIPTCSKFVFFSEVTSKYQVQSPTQLGWHKVYWPPQSQQKDEEVYDWCDRHMQHAWCVDTNYAFFQDQAEAVQFALLFIDQAHTT